MLPGGRGVSGLGQFRLDAGDVQWQDQDVADARPLFLAHHVLCRALLGPQTSDLLVRHGPKDMPAELCSTGEQKALLIRLVLAHGRLVERMSGIAPLLLLDEVAAHLDPARRAALYEELATFGAQVWMTGADPGLFAELEGRADVIRIGPHG